MFKTKITASIPPVVIPVHLYDKLNRLYCSLILTHISIQQLAQKDWIIWQAALAMSTFSTHVQLLRT